MTHLVIVMGADMAQQRHLAPCGGDEMDVQLTGPIALAACLQVDAVCHNAFIQEQSQGIHYNQANDLTGYLDNPDVFAFQDGFVDIPQGPGLGIRINEEVVRAKAAEGHRWRNPVWRHPDGSIAEW